MKIPYGKQNITKEDIDAVVEALTADFLTQGPKILEFEQAFAKYSKAKYAVALSNGTAALHLACMALDLNQGDKVITTPITFAASANCIKYCGGEVVFTDIDTESYLIDFEAVKKMLESSPKGTYKGIIPVDFAGRAVDLEKFRKLADKHGLWIIEDACHAPGGYFKSKDQKNQICGNGKWAEMTVFSFHPVKHIACGEGGMVTTNDEKLYHRLLALRTHGIVKNEDSYSNSIALAGGKDKYPLWYMEMQELGYNYRLTDIQAALGITQLAKADQGLIKRKEIARKYTDFFKDKPYCTGMSGFIEGHAYHLFVLEVKNRLDLYNHLRTKNIFTQIHYIPCHLMPYYQEQGYKKGDFPKAEKYYENCISIPMFPTLTEEELEYVMKTIDSFYGA
jgi:UDP-4-amino-4,6-dideoxy-N-acetyl-beta-L-altrosamine transaminase